MSLLDVEQRRSDENIDLNDNYFTTL